MTTAGAEDDNKDAAISFSFSRARLLHFVETKTGPVVVVEVVVVTGALEVVEELIAFEVEDVEAENTLFKSDSDKSSAAI